MRCKSNIVFSILIVCLLFQIGTAGENEYGIVKAWCDNQPATVEGVNLKISEPVEIKVEVTSKIDGFIDILLYEPGDTISFDVISGPGDFDEWISEYDVESGWIKVYTWTVSPNGNWVDGNAPINIIVQFSREINDDLFIRFTIAKPHILDEQYSASSPVHTSTDPLSTDHSPSNSSPGFGVFVALLGMALAVYNITQQIRNNIHLDPEINYQNYPNPADAMRVTARDLTARIEANQRLRYI